MANKYIDILMESDSDFLLYKARENKLYVTITTAFYIPERTYHYEYYRYTAVPDLSEATLFFTC